MDKNAVLEIRWIQAFTERSFFEFVDNKTICYSYASHICFLNLETKLQSVFQSSVREIGALTANGSKRIFAFSEQKLSPSIFVYSFPEFQLKNKLKGTAPLDCTSLALSDGGPFLGCCSSLPNYTITVWNWEKAEPICSQPKAGCDVVSLVFNPLNCFQLCALGTASITVWNIEKSTNLHVLKPRVIELPTIEDTVDKGLMATYLNESDKETQLPPIPLLDVGDKPEVCTKAKLTPAAVCWTATSELYVTCAQGFLLLVDPESLDVSVQFNPSSAEAIPELRQDTFQGLTLWRDDCIAVGMESAVHCLRVKGGQIEIIKTWQIEQTVTTVMHSPDNEMLVVTSNKGQIFTVNPNRSDEILKILDVGSGRSVAAAFSHTPTNICVSVKNSGEVQLWSRDGRLLGSLSLQTDVTCVACCHVAQYAAVGTASGVVLFVDLKREQQPQLIHEFHLDHSVDQIVFDQEGHYLFIGASDSHVFVVNAKPSEGFSVLGYTVVPGPVLSLSTQCVRDCEQVKLLVLCAGQKEHNQSGSLLTVLSLPLRGLAGPDCVDGNRRLAADILQISRYEVPHPIQTCVLGVGEIFAYCHQKRALQRFPLPKDADAASSERMVQLKPEEEVQGHPLGPACLTLSPHHLWLASVGRGGLLRVRETTSMDQFIQLQCHPYGSSRVGSVLFSADSQTLLTVGLNDGAIVCANLRMKDRDLGKMKKSVDSLHTGSEKLKASAGATTVDVTREEGTLPSPPPSHSTWLESRQKTAVKEENEQQEAIAATLRKDLAQLYASLHKMRLENETCKEIERLKDSEFILDPEEQRKQEALMEQAVNQVREEIQREIARKRYLYDVLKRDCWDSLKVKGKAIKAFHSDLEVMNYPLKERTEADMAELQRVQKIRKFEMAHIETVTEEEEEEGQEADSAAVMGSFSAQLGYSNPYVYSQFSLRTTEQRINQIVLLQDVIYNIKKGFDEEFEALHRRKLQEILNVRERNKDIRRIMVKLDMKRELWEPSLTDSEQPEKLFTVDDSEIKAEKYLTPEQKQEEERKKLEEQQRFAARTENLRELALNEMMGGALEVKQGDILEKEIPPPEFVLSKPDSQWDEEEKKRYEKFEKKTKELNEEKEKYKKSLETEMKKLHTINKDVTETFDENLRKLFEKKIRCEMAVNQEELKTAYLMTAVEEEQEMNTREQELKSKLEGVEAHKQECEKEVESYEEEVRLFGDIYDRIVDEDGVLDKDFKKEFQDVPKNVINTLYKLFKRRPRVSKTKTHTESNASVSKEPHPCGSPQPDELADLLQAMEELDAPENTPKCLSPAVWERFCLFRRTKVESEHKVKVNGKTFAKMQGVLQKKRDKLETAEQEIKNLYDALKSQHEEKNHFLSNIVILVPLKQEQVEVSTADFPADYSDSVLLDRSVVERLNDTIRTSAEQKIKSMVECKDFCKGIIQLQWEHKKLKMQMEDLNNKCRDIRQLKLTEEQRDYLTKKGHGSDTTQQVSSVEKTIAFQEKVHQKNVQKRKDKIQQIKRKAAKKVLENAQLEEDIANMQAVLQERRETYKAIAPEEKESEREKRYQKILQVKDLKSLVQIKEKEVATLRAEVERLRRRNYPLLVEPKQI
ncbi:cilia- and flagella-associated protein 43 isoform X1 [Takifugu rubripes]|uniref:cilia- and flagella-associated protein 43 isoform X1 n=1 Tax=Takifugu rubripes TaxID=31033 RepID=UPI0011454846|nr:cilia- and flagella-associated protein 43 isoform X1 [Takifugu rubripes]